MDTEAKAAARPEWRTIPNLLSFARLALVPLLGWLILRGNTNWATALFGAMAITDYLDGYIARRTDTVTDLGTTLDPVSDRVLAMAALVTMAASGILPWWLAGPVLARDAILSLVFLFVARRGFGKPKVRRVGKTATFALFTAMPGVLMAGASPSGFQGIIRVASLALFALGAILYFVAFFRYAQDVRTFLAHERRPFTN